MSIINKNNAKSFFWMTAASVIMAFGNYFFKFTNNFTFGGITGLAVVVAHTGLISAADFSFIANTVLLVAGILVLGRKFIAKTAYCSIVHSIVLSVLERMAPMSHPFTDQPMLELMFAVALPALGSAILFNMGASSGGLEIVAMIVKRYTSFNIGNAMLLTNLFVTVSGFFVFGIETGMYSLFGLLIQSFLVDNIIESMNMSKYFNVVCSNPEEICRFIVNELKRGATTIDAQGAFTGDKKYIIFTALNRHQAVLLRNFIKEVEPDAFILISNTSEIIGKGFHSI